MKKYTDFQTYLKRRLKDPKFKEEWDDSEIEYQLAADLIRARIQKGLTQKELAKRAKTDQAVISRIERGSGASTSTIKKLAEALGTPVRISLGR